MAKKRKAPSTHQPIEQKPKIVPEEDEEEPSAEEEEEEESEEESQSEESESGESEESDSEDDDESESESEDDESSKREALREMLEPFGKSQIIDLVKEAAVKDPKIVSKIVQVADTDPTHRKIFVYGLGWDATSEQLEQAFKPFGEIEESKLITDKNTGRAKGYAFVLFKTRAGAKKALKVPQKKIGSRTVSCQLAALGTGVGAGAGAGAGAGGEGGGSLKIYIGNVAPHMNPEKLKAFFRKFGEIVDGPIGMDMVTNRFKGFAVITYKTAEGYRKALEEPIKVFENCQLHCKKFVENANKNNVVGQSGAGAVGVSPGVSDVSYGNLGVNAGMLGTGLNASGLLMAQNPGIGLAGNAMLAAGYNYNPASLMASGLSMPIAGMGGNYGITSSVMGNYGSQSALHGLGPFQNAQTGQSSIGTAATATTATRAQASGASSAATYPSYSSYFAR